MAHPDARDARTAPWRMGGWHPLGAAGRSGRSMLRPYRVATVFVGSRVAGWGAGCGGCDIALVPAGGGEDLLDRGAGEFAMDVDRGHGALVADAQQALDVGPVDAGRRDRRRRGLRFGGDPERWITLGNLDHLLRGSGWCGIRLGLSAWRARCAGRRVVGCRWHARVAVVVRVEQADAAAAPFALGAAAPAEAALFELLAEAALADGVLAVLLAPRGVGGVERAAFGAGVAGDDAAVGDEAADDVHLAAVGLGGGQDFGWVGEAALVEGQAAAHGPGQDAGQLLHEPAEQGAVTLGLGDGHREGDEAQAAPDAFVGAAHHRAMVGGQEELEAGAELEELAVEKAGGERVARNDLFDQHLGEPATFLDLDRADEAGAGEAGDVVGDAVAALTGQKGGRIGLAAVVAGDGANDLQEG